MLLTKKTARLIAERFLNLALKPILISTASAATTAATASVVAAASTAAAAVAAAITAAATTVVAAATATAARAIFLRKGFIDSDGSSAEHAAVQCFDASVKLVAFDVNEAETAVWDDSGTVGLKIAEVHEELGFGGREGQVAHEESLGAHFFCYCFPSARVLLTYLILAMAKMAQGSGGILTDSGNARLLSTGHWTPIGGQLYCSRFSEFHEVICVFVTGTLSHDAN